MLNRRVRQIHPQEDKDSQTMTFGDYSEFPNIVLLGDPGAGKTHLFRQFAGLGEANYLTVRHFLSGVPIDNQKALFIDALDEKRSSHNSSDVVDDIVQRLFPKLRKRSEFLAALRTGWANQTCQHFYPILSGQGDMSFYICSSYQGKNRQRFCMLMA
ncbi:hypothetical protein ACR68D_004013 [Escherichia coli]